MIVEFFVVGGVLFWLLTVVAGLILIGCVENEERWIAGGVTMLVFFLLLIFLGDLGKSVVAHPLWAVGYVVGYPVAGLLWTVPWWILLVRRIRGIAFECKAAFCEKFGLDINQPIPPEMMDAWVGCISGSPALYRYGVKVSAQTGKVSPPTFTANRDRLVTCALLWPFSIFWTLFRDMVLQAIETVVDWCGQLYQKLSEWVFGDL
jgi:hypothetical protein